MASVYHSFSILLSAHPSAKNFRRGGDLFLDVAVVTDNHYTVAAIDQLPAEINITRCLGGLVMHRAVTENADVRCVKKVGYAMRFGDGSLRFVWQPVITCCQGREESSFNLRA